MVRGSSSMARGSCARLGMFGDTLKVGRKPRFITKRCWKGLHEVQATGGSRGRDGLWCRDCKLMNRRRYYWAKELARYFMAPQAEEVAA